MTRCAPDGSWSGRSSPDLNGDGRSFPPPTYRYEHVRRQIDASIRDGRNHGHQLQWCNRDLLANGDGTDGRRSPLFHWAKQTAGFAGQLHAGACAEAEVVDILAELILADPQRQFYRSHIAGHLERLMDWNHSIMLALIVVNDSSRELDLASLAIDHLIGSR